MRHIERSGIRPYVVAVVSTAAAIALTRLTWPFFTPTPFAPVFAAVAVSTHWGNGRAGRLAIILGAISAAGMFPRVGPNAGNPAAILAFIAVALIGNFLIAGRNRATDALRASEAQLRQTLDHLRASEETLRRAQKMEAVGQLAAGVAHNFNNLLTITLGYLDVLHDVDADDEMRHAALREIRKATDRGATLARHMLAVGRPNDARMSRLPIGETVCALRDVLTRVIRDDIRLTLTAATGAACVLIDPYDLEQVMFNLVINARDALPNGGTIAVDAAIETIGPGDRRREPPALPGDYARVRVQDNGTGMSPEVQAHLFEPFFTTKEVGDGTGLGLAFVHGIARHAGGFVTVESALGGGTTVGVYLPVASP